MQQYLESASGALVIIASFLYLSGVWRKKIQPTKATWLVWTIMSSLTAVSMYFRGVLNGQIATLAFCDIAILIAAFRYGNIWQWTKMDIVCIFISFTAIAAWIITGNALSAITLLLIATVVGFLPLARAVWIDPSIEKPLPWIIMVISSLLAIGATTNWSYEQNAQPVVYLLTATTALALQYRRRP